MRKGSSPSRMGSAIKGKVIGLANKNLKWLRLLNLTKGDKSIQIKLLTSVPGEV